MIDAYLKIEGIPGESTAAGYEDQIEVVSFSHGVQQEVSITASSAGGATVGRSNHHDFSITKETDKATPVLLQRCCQGTHIPAVTLTLVRAGGEKKVPFMVYTMTNVLISSVSYGASDSMPVETVTFNYGKIDWVYTQQKRKDGGGGGNTTGSWNVETNQAK